MPLPIGHALAGIATLQARRGAFFARGWLDVLTVVFLANLPDADFLPGILAGQPNLYHHGRFHSLGAALAVTAVVAALFWVCRRRFWPAAAMTFSLYAGHLLLDCFGRDFVPPYGLPLFWPLSGRYLIAAQPVFLNVTRSAAADDFFVSIFNRHNLDAALREAVILGGLALAAAWLRRRLRRSVGRP